VTDLFAKLVALGALPPSKPAEDEETLKPISWHSEAMKERQPAMIHSLYSGKAFLIVVNILKRLSQNISFPDYFT
jgi:hypothetical protein